MKHSQQLIDSLKSIQSHIVELEENYEQNPDAVLDELETLKDKVGDIADKLYDYEDGLFSQESELNGFVDDVNSCHQGRKLVNKICKQISELHNEITGYDEGEIMQMMFPDEDIYSEDFEDGLDIEDFYED